jgi:hypothetical protein
MPLSELTYKTQAIDLVSFQNGKVALKYLHPSKGVKGPIRKRCLQGFRGPWLLERKL